jgi:hypothetical protein
MPARLTDRGAMPYEETPMPSGGHARSGRVADPNSERAGRNAREQAQRRGDWVDLPASYTGKIPTFPLDGKTPGEHKLWRVLWRKPQAAMWARQGLTWQVAHYCRTFLQATEPGAPASLTTAVLRQEDTLGISTVGLQALRWRIVEDEVAEQRTARAEPAARPAPTRRLRPAAGE